MFSATFDALIRPYVAVTAGLQQDKMMKEKQNMSFARESFMNQNIESVILFCSSLLDIKSCNLIILD